MPGGLDRAEVGVDVAVDAELAKQDSKVAEVGVPAPWTWISRRQPCKFAQYDGQLESSVRVWYALPILTLSVRMASPCWAGWWLAYDGPRWTVVGSLLSQVRSAGAWGRTGYWSVAVRAHSGQW